MFFIENDEEEVGIVWMEVDGGESRAGMRLPLMLIYEARWLGLLMKPRNES